MVQQNIILRSVSSKIFDPSAKSCSPRKLFLDLRLVKIFIDTSAKLDILSVYHCGRSQSFFFISSLVTAMAKHKLYFVEGWYS